MRASFRTLPAAQAAAKKSAEAAIVHRRVEVTVEREVTSVLLQARTGGLHRCDVCGREVWMLGPDEAAAVSGTTPREVYRRVEENLLHFKESAAGAVLICSESLKALLEAGGCGRDGP